MLLAETARITLAPHKETEVRAEHRSHLERAVYRYDIARSAYYLDSFQPVVMQKALQLLDEHAIDPRATAPSRNALMVLALANEVFAQPFISQRPIPIDDVLDVVAVGKRADGSYGTLSGVVEEKTRLGKEGALFNPEVVTSERLQYERESNRLIAQHKDDELSLAYTREANRKDSGSMLDNVKRKLGLIADESLMPDEPIEVTVIRDPNGKVSAELGYPACITPEGAIYLTYNPNDPDIKRQESLMRKRLQHEFAHFASGNGFILGFRGLLFRGFNEAVTESSVDKPLTYEPEREVLKGVMHTASDIPNNIYQAYMGKAASQTEVLTDIVHAFGLRGFLYLSLMQSGNLDHAVRMIGPEAGRIYQPYKTVDGVLASMNGTYARYRKDHPLFSRDVYSPIPSIDLTSGVFPLSADQ